MGLESPQATPPAATSLGAKKASAFIPWGLREGGRPGACTAGPELRGRTHACRGRAGRPQAPPGQPFSGCRLTISASLSVLPPHLSAPALSWPPLCFSLHICQPICFLGPHLTPPTVQGTARAKLAWVRPEAQLLQLPICSLSCEVVQPIPLHCTLPFQTLEAQGAPALAP